MEATLPGLVAEVLAQVWHFVETACGVQADPKDFAPWQKRLGAMRHSTTLAGYVCEENLVFLMDLQIKLGKLWTNMLPSFISERMFEYSHLQRNSTASFPECSGRFCCSGCGVRKL
jgi:hypothetical protein